MSAASSQQSARARPSRASRPHRFSGSLSGSLSWPPPRHASEKSALAQPSPMAGAAQRLKLIAFWVAVWVAVFWALPEVALWHDCSANGCDEAKVHAKADATKELYGNYILSFVVRGAQVADTRHPQPTWPTRTSSANKPSRGNASRSVGEQAIQVAVLKRWFSWMTGNEAVAGRTADLLTCIWM